MYFFWFLSLLRGSLALPLSSLPLHYPAAPLSLGLRAHSSLDRQQDQLHSFWTKRRKVCLARVGKDMWGVDYGENVFGGGWVLN